LSGGTATVQALAVDGSTIYAGGLFATVDGGTTRSNAAAFDMTSGAATGWNPNADGRGRSLAVSGSTVYASGDFFHVGGASRWFLAGLDGSSGAATGFDPGFVDGSVFTVAVSGSTVYAGGDFSTVNGSTSRRNLAAFDASTGVATALSAVPG